MTHITKIAAALLLGVASVPPVSPALAQDATRSMPTAIPIESTIPEARDVPYVGPMTLSVDATEIGRGVFRTVQRIPVEAGTRRLTLLYPEWLPGKHSPQNNIAELNGITFSVAGQPVEWRRDAVDIHAFHLDLPEGADMVEARLIYTSPVKGDEGRIVATSDLFNLKFEDVSLYPAGYYVRNIRVQPDLTVPAGFKVATALDGKTRAGDTVRWAETDYQTLVDSPVFAGLYEREYDLGHDVRLALFADEPQWFEFDEEARIAEWRALIDESLILFGSKPFDHYTFLVAMTEKLGGIGLEHHRSTEITVPGNSFEEWEKYSQSHGVHAHELVHSWNGKYRRPAEMWTPDYRQPMIGEMLWLYEGMTSYWDYVLAARSGMQSDEIVKGSLARAAGRYLVQAGRDWRSVVDTTTDPIVSMRKSKPFYSLARGEEYYTEGAFVWLEADMLIRTQTRGKASLEDFAKRFFGGRDGDWGEKTYTFDDVVADLNAVYPYDWATFLRDRLYRSGVPAPVRGIELGGYTIEFKEEPAAATENYASRFSRLYLDHSLGMSVDSDGDIGSVLWDSPAFAAGLVRGAQIVAIDGEAYSHDRMKRAITAARDGSEIELLVKRGSRYSDVSIAYSGGLRYPHLVKTAEGTALLDTLLAPQRK